MRAHDLARPDVLIPTAADIEFGRHSPLAREVLSCGGGLQLNQRRPPGCSGLNFWWRMLIRNALSNQVELTNRK